jgi:hypothetical protein
MPLLRLLPRALSIVAILARRSSPSGALPGTTCHAAGRGIHFYASTWSPTCDCSAQLPLQSNGSFCDVGAKPPPACAKLSCNSTLTGPTAATCMNYSNVLPQPVLSGCSADGW